MIDQSRQNAVSVCDVARYESVADALVLTSIAGSKDSPFFSIDNESDTGDTSMARTHVEKMTGAELTYIKGGLLFERPRLQQSARWTAPERHDEMTDRILSVQQRSRNNPSLLQTAAENTWAICRNIISTVIAFFLGHSFAKTQQEEGKGRLGESTRAGSKQATSEILTVPSKVQSEIASANVLEKPNAAVAIRALGSESEPEADEDTDADQNAINMGLQDRLKLYALESHLDHATRAVQVRRGIVSEIAQRSRNSSTDFGLGGLSADNYDFDRVKGSCSENVLGIFRCPSESLGH